MNYSSKSSTRSTWSWINWLLGFIIAYLILFGIPYSMINMKSSEKAIIILGGGLTETGELPNHTVLRVKKAEQLYHQLISTEESAPAIITLSGGTTHKPNPRDKNGFPIWEASAAAKELIKRGIPAEHVYEENFSLDTVGNAYFLRTIHTEPSNIRYLHIITNNWHMERTRAIFQRVFSLPWDTATETSVSQIQNRFGILPLVWLIVTHLEKFLGFGRGTSYQLIFDEVDSGISNTDILKLRIQREHASLDSFLQKTKHLFSNMNELRYFLYQQHNAYASKRLFGSSSNHTTSTVLSEDLLKTY